MFYKEIISKASSSSSSYSNPALPQGVEVEQKSRHRGLYMAKALASFHCCPSPCIEYLTLSSQVILIRPLGEIAFQPSINADVRNSTRSCRSVHVISARTASNAFSKSISVHKDTVFLLYFPICYKQIKEINQNCKFINC